MDLARQKIIQKRERRKKIAGSVRVLTAGIPDLRNYPDSDLEKQAAAISADQRKRVIENKEFTKPVSQEAIDDHIKKMEAGIAISKKAAKSLPERPQYFLDDLTRMEWITKQLRVGGTLTADDGVFRAQYLASQTESQREFWQYQTAEI